MIYKRLSRGELLKALQDHAKIIMTDHEGSIEWNREIDCYCMRQRETRVFIDKFEENELSGKITMFRVIKVPAYDLSFDIMLGAIDTVDWMVELPEEGEQ